MKEEHLEYFKTIGIKEPIVKRIEEIYEFFKDCCPEEIEGVFISDYIKEDHTREYEDIRFFSEKYVMLAQDFLHQDTFIFAFTNFPTIHSIAIEKKDYDYKKATERSRMSIIIVYAARERAGYRASKENCDYLRDTVKKYIMSHMCK